MTRIRNGLRWIWIIPFMVAAPIAGLGCILLFQGCMSLTWPTAQATVIDSGPLVRFEYEVVDNGVTHRLRGQGEKYSFIITPEQTCKLRYPVGSSITIHQDFLDEDGYESTILAGPCWDAVLVTPVTLWIAIYSWRRFRRGTGADHEMGEVPSDVAG